MWATLKGSPFFTVAAAVCGWSAIMLSIGTPPPPPAPVVPSSQNGTTSDYGGSSAQPAGQYNNAAPQAPVPQPEQFFESEETDNFTIKETHAAPEKKEELLMFGEQGDTNFKTIKENKKTKKEEKLDFE